MVPFLDNKAPFPQVSLALDTPNGLLAAGADLSPQRLIDAYSKGIFPWYSEGEPILWWSPDPRTVFEIETYRPSRSLCRFVRKNKHLKVTINQDFKQVIEECSKPAENRESTWILDDMKQAYYQLHQLGHAHSIELWQDSQLVGGLYGIGLDRVFCGESMFSRISNASKTLLSCLIGYLKAFNFELIDCQVKNQHLISLGATEINRNDYIKIINKKNSQGSNTNIWSAKQLDATKLVVR